MKETVLPVEHPLGSEWILYGQDFGAKTDDLKAFDALGVKDIHTLRGTGIGASYFREFMTLNNFNVDTNSVTISSADKIPESLLAIEKEILNQVSIGTPFIIRSSAIGEYGGTGAYHSDIVIRTEMMEKDLWQFTRVITSIYGSYNTNTANLYRQIRNQAYDGMAILIHPLCGDRSGNIIQPIISGVMTLVNSSPTLRFVHGSGLSAVEMQEAIVLQDDQIQEMNIRALLPLLTKGSSWNSQTQSSVLNSSDSYINKDERLQVEAAIPKLMAATRAWQSLYEAGQSYYWEFSISTNDELPIIFQSTLIPNEQVLKELPPTIGNILLEGTDVVGTGIKEGRGIIWIGKGGTNKDDVALLNRWNRENKNYLLLILDRFFSSQGPQISLEDFSNAAAVIELQIIHKREPGILTLGAVDHTHKRGGTHFVNLCGQAGIPFLGAELLDDDQSVENRLGKPSQRGREYSNSGIWDVSFRFVNAAKSGRVELLGEVKRGIYEKGDLDKWANDLRGVANMLNGHKKTQELANVCYKFGYFLWDQVELPTMGFNPFDISRLSSEEKQHLLNWLPQAREGYSLTDEYADYLEAQKYGFEELLPFEQYMNELEELLKKSLNQSTISS
jgi:hypothetical protein